MGHDRILIVFRGPRVCVVKFLCIPWRLRPNFYILCRNFGFTFVHKSQSGLFVGTLGCGIIAASRRLNRKIISQYPPRQPFQIYFAVSL